eukprot:tig00021319_g20254.t1
MPKRSSSADDDESEGFTVRFTGEEFRDYEQYADTVIRYRLPIWSCPVTGKSGLTYEQALLTQRAAQAKVDFPRAWMEPLLFLVQHSQRQLNELVDIVYDKFKSEFIEGEEVHLAGESDATAGSAGRVTRVLGSWYKKSGNSSPKRVQYEVDFSGEAKTLPSSQLRKPKAPFSKQILKQKIREVAFKDTYPQAPWIVRAKVVSEFPTVPSTLPPNLQKVVDEGRKKKQRTEPESGPSEVRDAAPVKKYPMEDLELLKDTSNDRRFLTLPKPMPLPPYAGDLIYLCDLIDRYGKALKLSPFTYDQLLAALDPPSVRDDPVLLNELHVQLFKHIKEEFHTSTTEGDSEEEEERKREVKKSSRGKRKSRDTEGEVNHTSWRRQVREYLKEAQKDGDLTSDMIIWLEDTIPAYNQLAVSDKLRILKFLGDEALDTSLLRDEIDNITLQADVLRKEKWQYDSGYRDKKKKFEEIKRQEALAKDSKDAEKDPKSNSSAKQSREQARKEEAERKQRLQEEAKMVQEAESHRKRMEVFKRELSKLSIRHKCLGQDRHHNTYWAFRWDPRVFVGGRSNDSWSCYSGQDEIELLIAALNPKGIREQKLLEALNKEKSAIAGRIRGEQKEAVIRELGRRTTRVTAKKSDEEDSDREKGGYINRYNQNGTTKGARR